MKVFSLIRTLFACAIYPFYLTFWSLISLFCNFFFRSREIDDAIIRIWANGSCWMFGVSVRVQGLENVPAGGCLFLFNHTSFFDIFAMSAMLPSFRFGAKKELFLIPFLGPAMTRAGVLMIDRADRQEVFKVYEKSRERIARGERFALSPEGTRQATETLAPFKMGPFIFAISAKAPIVPVIIKNANAILPKNAWLPNWDAWHRTVEIQILPPISTDSESYEKRHELQAKVYDTMKLHFMARQV